MGKIKIITLKREELLIKWLKYYETLENIKYDLSVHYLFYNDVDYTKDYKIEAYKTFNEVCSTCNKEFYIKSIYLEHTH